MFSGLMGPIIYPRREKRRAVQIRQGHLVPKRKSDGRPATVMCNRTTVLTLRASLALALQAGASRSMC
jgi:hypothetical protein